MRSWTVTMPRPRRRLGAVLATWACALVVISVTAAPASSAAFPRANGTSVVWRDRAGTHAESPAAVDSSNPFDLQEFQPDVPLGGRAVAVDVDPFLPNGAIVASESG